MLGARVVAPAFWFVTPVSTERASEASRTSEARASEASVGGCVGYALGLVDIGGDVGQFGADVLDGVGAEG